MTHETIAQAMMFDGVAVPLRLDIASPWSDGEGLPEIADNTGRVSLSGVQPKLSAVVDEHTHRLRLTQAGEQGTYIIKPRPAAFHLLNRRYCPANEWLTMQIAARVYDIPTAANALCYFADGEEAYLTRRFDIDGAVKQPMEDFAALLGYTRAQGGSDFKYCNGSYEECADVIRKYSANPYEDTARFFRLVLFNFITLNDDAHLKNFSLLGTAAGYRLSPAYDLINTSLHIATPRLFALDHGLFREGMQLGDTRTVGAADFREFARRIGLPEDEAQDIIAAMAADSPEANSLIEASPLSDTLRHQYRNAMHSRQAMLR